MIKSVNRSLLWSRITVVSCFLGLSACQVLPKSQENDTETYINRDLLTKETSSSQPISAADANVIPNNIWKEIVAGYGFPQVNESYFQNHLRWYSNHQRYLDKVVHQSEPYLFYIKTQLKKNDLPLELALLPIIESAYDPLANSRSKAAGIWQFIPGTGRAFGLTQNHWFDGRRDLIASTDAAINYLTRLHKMFDGDWLLAVAAYNAGEGTVGRAIKRNRHANKPTDFWSLDLPKQTKDYVPQLLALAQVIADPKKYDLKIAKVANEPHFARVSVNKPIDIALAAKMTDMDPHHLRRLNAGHITWVTNTSGNYNLLVPVDSVSDFKTVLAEMPASKPIKIGGEYVVRSGDTLGGLATRHGTTIAAIQAANQLKGTNLRIGQRLAIPGNSNAVASSLGAEVDKSLAASRNKFSHPTKYQVKSGDSLWLIAKKHDLTLAKLLDLNNLTKNSTIKPGQTLIVSETSNVAVIDGKIIYQIQAGDTLNNIAHRFAVPKQKLITWNDVKDESYIHPGQELTIFPDK